MFANEGPYEQRLKRIADALGIAADDMRGTSPLARTHDQMKQLLALWEQLPTPVAREEAMRAVRSVVLRHKS